MIKEHTPVSCKEIPSPKAPSPFLKLNRNLAFLMLLLVCLASMHNQQLPNGQTVLTAVQSTLDENWDEGLGKITFVHHLLPETMAVFLEQPLTPPSLSLPCLGTLSHPWESHAPYISFIPSDDGAFSMADGEVMSLSCGANGSHSLRIRHEGGYETVYYHLAETSVSEGEIVQAGSTIGRIGEDMQLVVDVRKDGLSINPLSLLPFNPS